MWAYEKSIPYNVYCITSNTVGITATLFIPPLEEIKPDVSKMYIAESGPGPNLPSPEGGKEGGYCKTSPSPNLSLLRERE